MIEMIDYRPQTVSIRATMTKIAFDTDINEIGLQNALLCILLLYQQMADLIMAITVQQRFTLIQLIGSNDHRDHRLRLPQIVSFILFS